MRLGLSVVLGALLTCVALADGPGTTDWPAKTIMQIYVDRAIDVIVTDPRGRTYPCMDSTCTPIPDCGSVVDFSTRPRNPDFEDTPQLILVMLTSPLEGRYVIRATGLDRYITVTGEVLGPQVRCGQLGGVDGKTGSTYEWIFAWRRDAKTSKCVATLGLVSGRRGRSR